MASVGSSVLILLYLSLNLYSHTCLMDTILTAQRFSFFVAIVPALEKFSNQYTIMPACLILFSDSLHILKNGIYVIQVLVEPYSVLDIRQTFQFCFLTRNYPIIIFSSLEHTLLLY